MLEFRLQSLADFSVYLVTMMSLSMTVIQNILPSSYPVWACAGAGMLLEPISTSSSPSRGHALSFLRNHFLTYEHLFGQLEEVPEETHTDTRRTCRLHTEKNAAGIWTFMLWGDRANGHTTTHQYFRKWSAFCDLQVHRTGGSKLRQRLVSLFLLWIFALWEFVKLFSSQMLFSVFQQFLIPLYFLPEKETPHLHTVQIAALPDVYVRTRGIR